MNKYSIRWKFAGLFVLLILVFQSVFFVLSLMLLDDVLLWGTQRSMGRQFDEFVSLVTNDGNNTDKASADIESALESMSDRFGALMSFVDLENRRIYSTSPSMARGDSRHMRQPALLQSINQHDNLKVGETVIYFDRIPEQGKNIVVQLGRLADGYLMIERPVAAIQENLGILRAYIFISSLGLIVVGSVVIFHYSKRVTDPIIKIEEHAQKIAGLNFTHKTTIDGQDEIGQLGIAMNTISDQLNHTMSELQHANDKLRDEIAAEKRLEKMRRSFVSNVSHELKTPLSMIMGYADGLRNHVVKSQEQIADYAEIIFDESDKMNHLIKDLLDLSAYENGSFTIKKVKVELEPTLKGILSLYEDQSLRNGFQLKSQISSGVTMDADIIRVEQAIRNLLENAIKHVSEGGWINLTCHPVGNQIEIGVENQGPPISPEDLPRIWDSFYRGNDDVLAGLEGTGLGLSIVKAVVEGHQGHISVINTSSGVKFIIHFPKSTS